MFTRTGCRSRLPTLRIGAVNPVLYRAFLKNNILVRKLLYETIVTDYRGGTREMTITFPSLPIQQDASARD
jgi:hypothetical protein